MRKKAGKLKYKPNPALRTYYIEMEPPTLHDPEDDFSADKKCGQRSAFCRGVHYRHLLSAYHAGCYPQGKMESDRAFVLHDEIVRIVPGEKGKVLRYSHRHRHHHCGGIPDRYENRTSS